ncbi:MAG: hypothetical protein ISS23_00585 [Nanoarchaeota archaeon]|nr:hypothetical protein [Nanoarchaeota archaeon]
MKIKFEFPNKIKQFAKEEGIKVKDIKDKILSRINEDLLDKNYKSIKCKEIRIVINGIHKTQKEKVFISSKEISKKKPLKTISSVGLLKEYSIYYLILKEK